MSVCLFKQISAQTIFCLLCHFLLVPIGDQASTLFTCQVLYDFINDAFLETIVIIKIQLTAFLIKLEDKIVAIIVSLSE